MRGVLVDEGRRRVADEQLRHNEQADLFFAVERLLKNMAAIAVGREVHNAAPVEKRQVVLDAYKEGPTSCS
jgi:hypothetical protein